jgi:hypothetical protein
MVNDDCEKINMYATMFNYQMGLFQSDIWDQDTSLPGIPTHAYLPSEEWGPRTPA